MTISFAFSKSAPVGVIVALALASVAGAAQTVAGAPSSTELIQRIEGLEKQIVMLRDRVVALQKESSATPLSAGASQVAVSQSIAPAASESSSRLGGLLGTTTLSGLIDAYYGYNSNQPSSRSNGFRSFDTYSNQFSLNLVKLEIDKLPEPSNSRTGYRVALGFGQAIDTVNAADPGGLALDRYLQEAYFSYLAPVGSGLQVDVGKFVTPHGAEVIETKDNWNYSRGLLFSYAIPYFHYGMRTRYAFSGKYSVSGFLVNGWNNLVDNNSGKTLGVGFGWNPSTRISVTQNYMAGPEQSSNNSDWRQLWDTVALYTPSRRLSFMANYDYGRGDRIAAGAAPVFWTGLAAYARYSFREHYSLAVRSEYYDDHDGFTTGTAQHFHEVTGTLERMLASHIMSRLEFRRDHSSQPVFARGTGLLVNAQNTVTAGLVFIFDSREGR